MIRSVAFLRALSISIGLAMLSPLAASAHDANWRHEHQPPPRRTPPPPAPAPAEDWPDPYARERTHGGFVLSGGVAYFGPWDGDDRGGPGASLSALYQVPSGHFRIGGELFHRQYETQFFNVEDVDVDTYELNLLMHYVPFPGQVTPYLGGGLGVHINDIDGREVQAKDPTIEIEDDTGAGFGFFGLVGVEIPLGPHVALFGEGRIHLSYQEVGVDDFDTNDNDDDTVNTGGGSGLVGIRLRF